MTDKRNWKNTVLALALAALPAAAWAQEQTATPPSAQAQEQAQHQQQAEQNLAEAIAALEETANAIKALQEDNPAEAKAALERAIGKLEVTLAANPEMTLAPVDVATSVIDVTASPAEIRALRNEALRLMRDHQLQLARNLITGLASEIDISTTYIPLGTYPLALKSAAALIESGDNASAIEVLGNALGTLVVVETVLPLPLLNAESLIAEARELSEKEGRSEEENARLAALLDALDVQIARGEALEYGGAGAFDSIRAEMKEIRRATRDGGFGTGLFDKLRGLFGDVGRDHAAASN